MNKYQMATRLPTTLAALVKQGLLKREPVSVVWTLTDAGREALKSA